MFDGDRVSGNTGKVKPEKDALKQFRVQGLVFRVLGLMGFRVYGFRVYGVRAPGLHRRDGLLRSHGLSHLQEKECALQVILLLMIQILHYLKDPILWELWYMSYYGSCRIYNINRRDPTVIQSFVLKSWLLEDLGKLRRRRNPIRL